MCNACVGVSCEACTTPSPQATCPRAHHGISLHTRDLSRHDPWKRDGSKSDSNGRKLTCTSRGATSQQRQANEQCCTRKIDDADPIPTLRT
eukprot:scaffold153340_cov41-Tisochrysis_lutea.AAC.1